jgi:hypothetical protein
MKFFYLIVAFIFIAVFSFSASAQLCGSFGVTLNVHDNELNPVKDHTIRIVPWLKDELKGKVFEPVPDKPGASEIKLSEGHVVIGKYKIIVSAPGFLDTEKAIDFPHCIRLSYDILLLKKKEKYRTVTGHVSDDEGRSANYIGVTFTGEDGASRSVSTDFIGNYEIKLKPGKYTVTVKKSRLSPYENKKFMVPADGKIELRIALESAR